MVDILDLLEMRMTVIVAKIALNALGAKSV